MRDTMGYELHDGRILTWSLEVHLTDHCNLRCQHCCTLSPHLAPAFLSPGTLRQDLARVQPVLRPHVFKITGGEPLLHPEIVPCLAIARESGISDQLSVTTNGFLLSRMPDRFFELIDRLTISLYTSHPLPASALEAAERRCRARGVALTVKAVATFGQMTPENLFQTPAEAQAGFAGCWLRARCHLLHQSRFYVCTRPPHLEAFLAARGHPNALATEDGVSLEGPDLLARLLERLESGTPLASCRSCLGGSGERRPHRQLATGA